jgi:hypothetical protein
MRDVFSTGEESFYCTFDRFGLLIARLKALDQQRILDELIEVVVKIVLSFPALTNLASQMWFLLGITGGS